MPSAMSNPTEAARDREAFTFTGILKQVARGRPPSEISNTAAVQGLSLRRITARGEPTVFYVDPQSTA